MCVWVCECVSVWINLTFVVDTTSSLLSEDVVSPTNAWLESCSIDGLAGWALASRLGLPLSLVESLMIPLESDVQASFATALATPIWCCARRIHPARLGLLSLGFTRTWLSTLMVGSLARILRLYSISICFLARASFSSAIFLHFSRCSGVSGRNAGTSTEA